MIPKSEFNVGDRVNVRCCEAEYLPYFEAYVIGVSWRGTKHEYVVQEVIEGKLGMKLDGYTADWLTHYE